jgi:flagellar motor protein MotB
MRIHAIPCIVLLGLSSTAASSQQQPQPLYKVTIVSRTTKAINYGYLSAPTRVDFKSTPLLEGARGEAVIEPGRGATMLKMQFEDVPAPSRFGPNYLTYVVWAISPDGRAQNIGELVLEGGTKAKLHTSTPLQTFAMIVTAEPYYSVTQPSDVVVMENVVGRGTIGKVEEVNATYELLPRKPYTFDPAAQPKAETRLVSKEQHESITALYQALNAIQIAQSQGADKYAPERINRARALYEKARGFPVHLSKEIVSMAREAAQIAEDSRAIAVKRAQAEREAEEQRNAVAPPPPAPPAPAPRPVPPPADQQRSRAVTPPPAPQPQAAVAPEPAAPPIEVDHSQFTKDDPQAVQNRRRVLGALPRSVEVIDSSRGVVVTLPGNANASAYAPSIASAVRGLRGLRFEIEGHTDPSNAEAERVRQALVAAGVSPNSIIVRGFGNTKPRGPRGSAQNRRVEVIIAGDAIGNFASWDRSYSLLPSRQR